MSTVSDHLKLLKTYAPPGPLDGVNKIYFLQVIEKPGKIKVGDTHRDVEERNFETIINSCLHRYGDVTFVPAFMWNGSTYRDKKFHAFLRKKKYKFELNDKGRQSEWVEATPTGEAPTVELLLEELSEFVGKPVYKQVELRPAQHYALELLEQARQDGYRYVNFGACVRIGKTIISLTHAANNNSMPVYIGKNLTSQASAEADNEMFGIAPEMLTQSLHGIDEMDSSELSKKACKVIDAINKANTEKRNIVFYIDEVDDASHTKKSRDVITPVVTYFHKKNMVDQVIPMSGTRIYRGEKILRDLPEGDIKAITIEYYEMQILQPETTCNRNFRHISYYSESGDGLANISDAMKNKNHGHKSLGTTIQRLLGTNEFEFEVNPDFPHWFIKFATVGKGNANAFVRYLNRNHATVENVDYHYAAINGDVTKSKKAQEYCRTVIANNPDKVCVFISQGMATTSFSVTGIGNSAVFTDNELTADDCQALHRSATWAEGKTDCNMLVITTNDSMEHSFDDIFEDETKLATTREEKIEVYRELLNNNSMIHYTVDGSSVRPVRVTQENADKMLDKKAQKMTRESSIVHVLADLDEEILDKIFVTVTGKKSTSKKSKTAKGSNFDPFGEQSDKTIKEKNQSAELSKAAKEKILRAFANNAVYVPAIAREQGVAIEDFTEWDYLEISPDLFFSVYNSSWMFRDRIDTIYSLCEDDEYLVTTYIDKLAA